MEIDYSTATQNSYFGQTSPNLGKWIYIASDTRTLNYIEYDPTAANKKKTFTITLTAGNNVIKARSPNLDCVLSFVAGTSLEVVSIGSTEAATTVTNLWATVVTSNHLTTA